MWSPPGQCVNQWSGPTRSASESALWPPTWTACQPHASTTHLMKSARPCGPYTWTGVSAFSCPFSRDALMVHSMPGRPMMLSDARLLTKMRSNFTHAMVELLQQAYKR